MAYRCLGIVFYVPGVDSAPEQQQGAPEAGAIGMVDVGTDEVAVVAVVVEVIDYLHMDIDHTFCTSYFWTADDVFLGVQFCIMKLMICILMYYTNGCIILHAD